MAEITREQFIADFQSAPLNAFEISQSTFLPNDPARNAAVQTALRELSYDWNRTPEKLGQFFDRFLDDAFEAPQARRQGVALNVPDATMTAFHALRDPRTLTLRGGPPVRGPEVNVTNNMEGAQPAASAWVDRQFPKTLRTSMSLIDRLVPESAGLPPLRVDLTQEHGGTLALGFKAQSSQGTGAETNRFTIEASITRGRFDATMANRMVTHELGHVAVARYLQANAPFMKGHLEVRDRVVNRPPDQVAPEDLARYKQVDHTMRPYHELLADVFNVTASGDPVIAPRRSLAGGHPPGRPDDEHHAFDATRQWLWSNVYSGAQNHPERRAEAMTRVFATVSSFMESHVNGAPPRDWRTPALAAQLNAELIAQLETTFRR